MPKPRIKISGGHLIDPHNQIDDLQDLYIADGCVVAAGNAPDGFNNDIEVDASGLIVIPGLIDLNTRLREPGQEFKASIDSECRAAAASGITTLCCPPDTDPVIDTPAVVELIRHRAAQAGTARIFSLGALTRGLKGEHLSEMAALKAAGCLGVSNALQPLASTLVQRHAFEYAATFDLTVFLHANDTALAANGCMHEGHISTRLGLPGIPEAAETVAVARDLALIQQTGVRAHFCRLTTQRAVRMVARAQFDDLPVSADVAIPNLFLTELDVINFGADYHFTPPLRTQEDRDGLRAGLGNGTLSVLCSDHQPHDLDAKLSPFPATEPGASGLDSLLPLTLKLVQENHLLLHDAIARITSGPAGVLNLPYGELGIGRAADVCIYDPNTNWRLDADSMHSQGKNTPFRGWEMQAQVRYTLLDGEVIYRKE
ncbi:Dihydroorotase [hydrothermal vent metagenome]|uniref:Dihydroorotase n=1 Tax=hydrothermal vent metagenome TaxID=652676 RepID=A0A3B0YFN4_9ZZZZ